MIQEDCTKDKRKADKMKGETKAAVLIGDTNCLNLVAFSIYNSKPVHFFSMSAEN